MAVAGYTKLKEIFRKGAGLDLAKGHAKEITDIVETMTHYPSTIALEVELENRLSEITGGILLTMAKIMKAVDHKDRSVDHELINKAKTVLDLTV